MINNINNLNNAPRLKELLTDYVSVTYEENAVINDWNLLAECSMLLKNNELHLLFEAEQFTNEQMKFK